MNFLSKDDDRPPGWAADTLTSFIDNVRQNQFATFYNKPMVNDLVIVERVLRTLVSSAEDPAPWFPFQFMLRGHAVFLAAACCAMAGQHYECATLQRASLECAAYGLFIGDSDSRARLWLGRHSSAAQRQEVRSAFSVMKIVRDMKAKDAELARTFSLLYETTIDFGAHPNERAFSSNTSFRTSPSGDRMFDTVYLHEDGPQLDFALKGTVQQGIWNAMAFKALYPAIFQSKGVNEDVQYLRSRY